jgi:peptide/nickel transport system substrate-binding protein
VSCAEGPAPTPTGRASATPSLGGTLRVAVPHDIPFVPSSLSSSDPSIAADALDPHLWGWFDAAELLRCCLVRTLMSYPGLATAEGGTHLETDLAISSPDVSPDGLTWTFRLQQGLRYAPPLEDVEITSSDIVRSILRALVVLGPEGGYAALETYAIVGVPEFLAGQTASVAGLEVPDRYTLRIRLERPAGDLPARFAALDTSPIPPDPRDPTAIFGVATGHDEDYGRFVVASGPYMIEGADLTDFGVPPADRVPAPGYLPSRSLTLVRNPSWDRSTDGLRPAYVDRIEVAIGGTLEERSSAVDRGEIDLVHYAGAPPQAPSEQIAGYPSERVHTDSRDIVRYLEMNQALPPFDDVRVRQAVNLAIDKARLIDLAGGPRAAAPAGHLVLDSLEDNLLLSYDPYRTPGSAGSADAARTAMRGSSYDDDGDGQCDDPACEAISLLAFRLSPEQVEVIVESLAAIGLTVVPEATPTPEVHGRWFDPAERIGLAAGLPFIKDFLNPSSWYRALFDSRYSMSDEVTNGSMVGASRERLERWGYDAIDIVSIDDRIDLCVAQVGGQQTECWAELDQYLMEVVVPWAPLMFERYTRTTGERVAEYAFDQLMAQPAFDRIALRPAD